MHLHFHPLPASDRTWLESLHTACYRPVVEDQFGDWDPDVQAVFFQEKWNTLPFMTIELDEQRFGVFAVEEAPDTTTIHEILIAPEHQGRGYGSAVIQHILDSAKKAAKTVKLKVLLKHIAFSLYKRMGFPETNTDDTHRYMEWKPA